MSELKRYDPYFGDEGPSCMERNDDGEYCLATDADALLAERDERIAELEENGGDRETYIAELEETVAAQLEEIERLTQTQADFVEIIAMAGKTNTDLRAENAELRERCHKLRVAGRPMATWMFNVSQNPHMAIGQEAVMREMCDNWDAALTPPEPQEADDGE